MSIQDHCQFVDDSDLQPCHIPNPSRNFEHARCGDERHLSAQQYGCPAQFRLSFWMNRVHEDQQSVLFRQLLVASITSRLDGIGKYFNKGDTLTRYEKLDLLLSISFFRTLASATLNLQYSDVIARTQLNGKTPAKKLSASLGRVTSSMPDSVKSNNNMDESEQESVPKKKMKQMSVSHGCMSRSTLTSVESSSSAGESDPDAILNKTKLAESGLI